MERIEGLFLSFESKELEEIKKKLQEEGYEGDGAGLKEFIRDCLFEEEESDTDRMIKKAQTYITRNEQAIKLGVGIVSRIIKARHK